MCVSGCGAGGEAEGKGREDGVAGGIFPHLKDCTFCPRTNRKEESVTSRLHCNGHSYITHSFLLMGEKPPVCIACDERIKYRTSFTFLFWFY